MGSVPSIIVTHTTIPRTSATTWAAFCEFRVYSSTADLAEGEPVRASGNDGDPNTRRCAVSGDTGEWWQGQKDL